MKEEAGEAPVIFYFHMPVYCCTYNCLCLVGSSFDSSGLNNGCKINDA